MSIYDLFKPKVRVEKRKLEKRIRPVRKFESRKKADKKPLGPLAKEIVIALQYSPGRFPRHWIKD